MLCMSASKLTACFSSSAAHSLDCSVTRLCTYDCNSLGCRDPYIHCDRSMNETALLPALECHRVLSCIQSLTIKVQPSKAEL